jgi:NAD(P)-dependent dehydrogenase (short-subunit alcohol dehydrogenase family)
MDRLGGSVALITGSTSGIGAAIATRFAAEGATVVVTGRSIERGAAVAAACGPNAVFVAADLSSPAAPDALVAATMEQLGRIDILVSNAAITGGARGTVVELDDDTWAATLAVDLVAPARLCRAVIPHMVASGGGAIVFISSRAAERGTPGQAAYSAAKAGLGGLARSIAVDFAGAKVRCNVVSPGYVLHEQRDADIDTARRARFDAMHPLGVGEAADVADAAVFLASAESRWITGITLPLDGGSTIARGTTFG